MVTLNPDTAAEAVIAFRSNLVKAGLGGELLSMLVGLYAQHLFGSAV